jgi:hypothetical protein
MNTLEGEQMKRKTVGAPHLFLILSMLVLGACASRKSYEPLDAPAVSVERVYEILASAEGSADPEDAEVDRWFGPWEMVGPLPAAHGVTPFAAEEDWLQGFADAAAASRATLSEQAVCYARQRAAISAQSQVKVLAEELDAFLASRCGLPAPPGQSVTLRLPAETTSEMVRFREEEIRRSLSRLSLSETVQWGAAFGKGERRSVIVLVSFEPTYRFDPFPLQSGASGEVVISGTALHPVREVIGYSDTGLYASAACRRDTTVLVPGFRLICPVGRDLPFAQISLLELVEGNTSFLDVQRLLVAPSGGGTRFALPEVGEPSDPTLPIELQTVELLNRVRTKAGLEPVVLHEPSQAFAGGAALFSAQVASTDPRWSELVNGLGAGWFISEAHLTGSRNGLRLPRKEGVSGVVASMLINPRMRKQALDPRTRFVSLGVHDGRYTRTVESIWFKGIDESASTRPDAARFIERVNEMRAVQGLAPAQRAGKRQREALEGAAVAVGMGLHPRQALEEARSELGRWTRDPIWTYIYSFDELTTIEMNADFFSARNIVLDVAVVPYREPSVPFTYYRALMLFRVQK